MQQKVTAKIGGRNIYRNRKSPGSPMAQLSLRAGDTVLLRFRRQLKEGQVTSTDS